MSLFALKSCITLGIELSFQIKPYKPIKLKFGVYSTRKIWKVSIVKMQISDVYLSELAVFALYRCVIWVYIKFKGINFINRAYQLKNKHSFGIFSTLLTTLILQFFPLHVSLLGIFWSVPQNHLKSAFFSCSTQSKKF